jgi:hypothetical protein
MVGSVKNYYVSRNIVGRNSRRVKGNWGRESDAALLKKTKDGHKWTQAERKMKSLEMTVMGTR